MSRLYIAAPLEARDTAREWAERLAELFDVISTWHVGPPVDRAAEADLPDWRIARELAANEHEISRADLLLVLHPSAGRETLVELGLALARRVPAVVLDANRLASFRRPGVAWIDSASATAQADVITALIES